MLEALSRTSSEAVKAALAHLGEHMSPHQETWFRLNGTSMLCVDKQDQSLQYIVLFGIPKTTLVYEVTTSRILEGYKSFLIEIQRERPGVPLITFDYSE